MAIIVVIIIFTHIIINIIIIISIITIILIIIIIIIIIIMIVIIIIIIIIFRSRILSHKFRHLRGHIVRLQARCRGALVRRSYEKKLWAVIKIQSHVRTMIAVRQYRKLKVRINALDFICASTFVKN